MNNEKNCSCGSCSCDSSAPAEHSVQWGMLLSHHAPCDYDRTWKIGKVRICTRCVGMLAAFIVGLVTADLFVEFTLWQLAAACAVLMLPAAADFVCHELFPVYRSGNFIRVVTGMIFGYPIGVLLGLSFVCGSFWAFLAVLGYAAIMQVVIGFIFLSRGHLEAYLSKYELAVFGKLKSFHQHDDEDTHSCSCGCNHKH